ncbi:hypothetical protein D0C36_21845 [Mucilaginibacter conchicola]|uniref:Beta-lactamase-related domain-containing protein n=1 Tax=Mucilaginibacter conchicola TaxID=2303333 RepID=A0A372NP87_9SPHI|nr:serine hydrolase [Mucilaginibacter conchicola]RFZ90437.1 hypothetical protein D0C36_21845 [Mucilaginibacter conchicola]
MRRLLLMLMLALPALVTAQDIAKKADSLLTTYTSNKQFSGNALIAKNGKIVFEKAYGFADKEQGRLNNLQTEFRAGSLTKMFTAVAVLQLAEQGKLSLHDKVGKYIHNVAGGDSITLKNLLSHTSGIRGNIQNTNGNLAQMVSSFKSDGRAFAPGERFEYNNFNFILLGYIAQKVSGKPYAQLLTERIFKPAGMQHTGIDYKGRKAANVALGYMIDDKTQDLARMETGNINAASGAGALYTTVGDLLKFSTAIDAHKILSAKSFELAFTPVKPGYGLGFTLRENNGHPKTGHTGSIEGFMAEFMKFRKDDITVIFLSNLLPPVDHHLDKALASIAFNEPFEIETGKKGIEVSVDALQKYTGTYELEGAKMVISVKEGKLMALAPGGDEVELVPEATDKFFVKGPQIGVIFKEENGKVTAMFLDMRGGQTFKRVQ